MKRANVNINIEELSTGTVIVRGNIAKGERNGRVIYERGDKEFREGTAEENMKAAIKFADKHQKDVFSQLT